MSENQRNIFKDAKLKSSIERVEKDENEIVVDMKLKIDMQSEHSARGIQTAGRDDILVSIQRIT